MKKFQFILLLFVVTVNYIGYAQIVGYKEMYNGIMVEQFSNEDSLFQCSDDNTVYTIGKTFVFICQYVSNNGNTISFVNEKNTPQWNFISVDSVQAASYIYMRIPEKSEAIALKLYDYQTVIEFLYVAQNQKNFPIQDWTWLIENPKNVIMQPPRQYLIKILLLNPYPYIQFPINLKKKWKWKQEILGYFGADERWKTWEGLIANKYTYTITDTACSLPTLLGILTCCKVESKATSKLGKTFLTSYYNDTYGFVRLEYVNIDNSTITMELIKVE